MMKKKLELSYNKFADLFTRELLEATLPSLLLIAVALVVAYKFIDPAPPRHIVITTGDPSLNYSAFASIYGVYLQEEGVTLEMHESSGDVENLKRLKDPDSEVDVAFIQDGIASTEGAGSLLSLGSLYYEPAWIFCRCRQNISHLAELKGKRIAIGKPGKGTHALSQALLSAGGITAKNTPLIPVGGDDAAKAILQGKVDATILVDVPDSPVIQKILADPTIKLVSLSDAEAYTRQFSYLHHLILPEGSLNLARTIPARDVDLVAPTATLVVKENVHPALVYLMLKVIAKVHGGPGMLHKAGDFPSAKGTDFPLSSQAANFYKTGLPFIDKYLPFWAATFVNRTLIVILPLLALLIPLTKIIPIIYTWLVKRKVYRYYGALRYLENQLKRQDIEQRKEDYLEKLNEIEDRVRELKLPVTFSQHAYELRAHIELVRSKLERTG